MARRIHDRNVCFTKVFQHHQHRVDFQGSLLPNTWDMGPCVNILFNWAIIIAARCIGKLVLREGKGGKEVLLRCWGHLVLELGLPTQHPYCRIHLAGQGSRDKKKTSWGRALAASDSCCIGAFSGIRDSEMGEQRLYSGAGVLTTYKNNCSNNICLGV